MKKLSKYGKVVKELDKHPRKLTQMIADELGVSASYVYKVKRDRKNAGYTVTTDYYNDAVGCQREEYAQRKRFNNRGYG